MIIKKMNLDFLILVNREHSFTINILIFNYNGRLVSQSMERVAEKWIESNKKS
jgi:hypothetical protein